MLAANATTTIDGSRASFIAVLLEAMLRHHGIGAYIEFLAADTVPG